MRLCFLWPLSEEAMVKYNTVGSVGELEWATFL